MSHEALEESFQAITRQLHDVVDMVCREREECVSSHSIVIDHNYVIGGMGTEEKLPPRVEERNRKCHNKHPNHGKTRAGQG